MKGLKGCDLFYWFPFYFQGINENHIVLEESKEKLRKLCAGVDRYREENVSRPQFCSSLFDV